MPTKPMGPPTETAAPVARDALKKRESLRKRDVDAVRLGAVGAQAQQVERTREPGEDGKREHEQRERRYERLIGC